MTPTTQRVEGSPHGECVRASYASLLDLPIELVPRFDPAALSPGEAQGERQRRWLHMLGLDLVELPPTPAVLAAVPPVYHLLAGRSPRGFLHQCVGFGGRLAWDPHPSRAGLTSLTSLGFVVPRC